MKTDLRIERVDFSRKNNKKDRPKPVAQDNMYEFHFKIFLYTNLQHKNSIYNEEKTSTEDEPPSSS